VKAEPAQMEQVLMNICLNARDAMPDGGMLRIKTEMILLDDSFCQFYPGVAAGAYVVLSISDTGSGMSPEVRERIFEPFYTTKERGKGSGMGLPRFTVWCVSMAALFTSIARSGRAHCSMAICPR
jgi:signal transduction histidine kinase